MAKKRKAQVITKRLNEPAHEEPAEERDFFEPPQEGPQIEEFVRVIAIKRFVSLSSGAMFDDKQFVEMRLLLQASKRKADLINVVERLTYRPGAPRFVRERGASALNTYRPSSLNRTSGDVKPWLDLVHYIFPDDGPREHFLRWCAHHLQKRDTKINHSLFLASQPGIGKDSLIEPIIAATGQHNTGIITQLDLATQQNDYILNRRLIIGQELMATKNWRTLANQLKPYLAAPPNEIRVNRKNVPQFDVPNIANWIFLTNSETPLAIEEGDRRFFFYWSPAEPKEPEFYVEYHHWVKDHAGDVLGFLLDYDISNFDPKARPPMTAAKLELIESSRPDVEQFLRRALDGQTPPFDDDLVTIGGVLARLPPRLRCSEKRLGNVLRKLGARHLRQAIRRSGPDTYDRPHVWAVRNSDAYGGLTETDLGELLNKPVSLPLGVRR